MTAPTPPGRVANPPTPTRGAPHATARFWTVWLVLMTAAVVLINLH